MASVSDAAVARVSAKGYVEPHQRLRLNKRHNSSLSRSIKGKMRAIRVVPVQKWKSLLILQLYPTNNTKTKTYEKKSSLHGRGKVWLSEQNIRGKRKPFTISFGAHLSLRILDRTHLHKKWDHNFQRGYLWALVKFNHMVIIMKIITRFWVFWEPKPRRTSLGSTRSESTVPRGEDPSITKWTVFWSKGRGCNCLFWIVSFCIVPQAQLDS